MIFKSKFFWIAIFAVALIVSSVLLFIKFQNGNDDYISKEDVLSFYEKTKNKIERLAELLSQTEEETFFVAKKDGEVLFTPSENEELTNLVHEIAKEITPNPEGEDLVAVYEQNDFFAVFLEDYPTKVGIIHFYDENFNGKWKPHSTVECIEKSNYYFEIIPYE